MPPSNLRAVIAQMYRGGSRQAARNFSSSPPGESVIATGLKKSRDSSSVPEKKNPSVLSWVVAGYTLNFVSSWMMAMHRQRIVEKRMDVLMVKGDQALKRHSV